MAIRKTGSRPIVVDGVAYRWRVRHRLTYDQQCFGGSLTVAIQAADAPGCTLLARGQSRPDNLLGDPSVIVTPATVAAAIRRARADGWRPDQPGGPVTIDLASLPVRELNR